MASWQYKEILDNDERIASCQEKLEDFPKKFDNPTRIVSRGIEPGYIVFPSQKLIMYNEWANC